MRRISSACVFGTAILILVGQTVSAQFATPNLFHTGTSVSQIKIADIDGDMDNDVVGISTGYIIWFENTDGEGTMVLADTIRDGLTGITKIVLDDMDGDMDTDIAISSEGNSHVFWKENLGGGMFGMDIPVELETPMMQPFDIYSLVCAQITGDTLPELIIASDSIRWAINSPNGFVGKGATSRGDNVPQGSPVLLVGDIDMDNDPDIITMDQNRLIGSMNMDGTGTTWGLDTLAFNVIQGSTRNMDLFDVDNDGDLDIMGQNHHVNWWKNQSADGMQWPSFEALSFRSPHAAMNYGTVGRLGCGSNASLVWNSGPLHSVISTFDQGLGDFPIYTPLLDQPTDLLEFLIAEMDSDTLADLVIAKADSLWWSSNTMSGDPSEQPTIYLNGDTTFGGSVGDCELPVYFTSSSAPISIYPYDTSPTDTLWVDILDNPVGSEFVITTSSMGQDSCLSSNTLVFQVEICTNIDLNMNDVAPILWPNPTADRVNVTLDPADKINTYQVIDIYGRVVQEGALAGNSKLAQMVVSDLAIGQYWLRLLSNNGSTVAPFTIDRLHR